MRIDIDYVGGSHGQFLEFVLTKLLFPDKLPNTPFTDLGTSHNKTYERRVFFADHYTKRYLPIGDNVIRISFTPQDLLALMSISLMRVGDDGYKDTELEINTYNKLQHHYYQGLLANLLSSYQDHLGNVNSENPNIDRYILREFFKFGFKIPSQNGFIKELEQMQYTASKVIDFEYGSFYNIDKFLNSIEQIRNFFDLTYQNFDINSLHQEFLIRQPYKDIKYQTDSIVEAITHKKSQTMPTLTLFQESYINAELENIYDLEMPFRQDQYFTHTDQIWEYINGQTNRSI